MIRKKCNLLLIAAAVTTLTSCGDFLNSDDNNIIIDPPTLHRIELTAEQKGMVTQSNDLAFNLARNAQKREQYDVLLSPLSASYVLTMLENGADASTRAQMVKTLAMTGHDEEVWNDYYKRMLKGAPAVDASVKLQVANAILADNDYPLKKDFSDKMKDIYGANIENLDFDTVDIVAKVNKWANDHTDGMIDKILESTNNSACLFALNAIYFKGEWASRFDSKQTKKDVFTTIDKNKTSVNMMQQMQYMPYTLTENFEMIAFPYGNGGFSMEIILPKEGKSISDILANLDGKTWKYVFDALRVKLVDLHMPRFTAEYSLKMNDMLQSMGMEDAFDPEKANFMRLSEKDAFISQILHKCKIEVTESGTKAAGVTVGEMDLAVNNPSVETAIPFYANRPFIYLITENTTGNIYFIGTKTK